MLLSISLAVSLGFLALYWLQRYRKRAHAMAAGIATRAASRASATLRGMTLSLTAGDGWSIQGPSRTPSQESQSGALCRPPAALQQEPPV